MAKKDKEDAADTSQASGTVIKVTKKKPPVKVAKKKAEFKVTKTQPVEKPQEKKTPPVIDPPGHSSKPEEVYTPILLDEETKEMLTRTHTPKPASETKLEFGDEMRKIILTGGTLQVTKEQNKILFAEFKDTDVSMKPDGLIYLPWIKYSARLTEAFGGTGWVLIPEGMPKENNSVIYWGFHLVIKGVYCGFSIGEQQYFNNGRMTYGEACEGAKSNALTRLCKGLGIGIKLWDKNFIEGWLNKYAVFSWEEDPKTQKRKRVYKLKGNPTVEGTTNTGPVAPTKNDAADTKNPGNQTTHQHPKKTPAFKKEDNDEDQLPLVKMFEQKLRAAKSITALHSEYHQVKLAWNNGSGTITKEEKEKLRELANDLAVALEGAGQG